MKKIALLLTLITFLSTGIFFSQKSLAQAGGFIVYPNVIHLDFAKNKRRFVSKVVAVENNGSKPTRVKAYTEAWDMDKDSNIEFISNDSPTSLNKFLKFNPREFDLQPGQKQLVRITAKLPEGIDGEFRSFIFFENVPTKDDLITSKKGKLGIVVEIKSRFGVAIYAYKGNTSKDAALETVKYEIIDEKPFIVSTIKNNGNIHNTVIIDYELTNKETKKKVERKSKIIVMPERTQSSRLALPIKEMEPGEYNIDLKYTYKDINDKPVIFTAQTDFNYEESMASLKNDLQKVDNDEIKMTPENIAKPIELKPEAN